MAKLYLGIDIGASSVKYGWGNSLNGLQHFGKVRLLNNRLASVKLALDEVINVVSEKVGLSNIIAGGVGTPGYYDINSGTLVGVNPNLPEWTNLDPLSVFSSDLRDRLVFDNDANLMALCESHYAEGSEYVLGITIGSGIGCGYVTKGQIYHGAHGYAMELGHNIVVDQGELCNCGKYGCLEAYTAVNGIRRLVDKVYPSASNLDISDIYDLAKENEAVARILDHSIFYLAFAISNLVINLDCNALVIGGGVAEYSGFPLDRLKQEILSRLPDIQQGKLSIFRAKYGNKSGVLGGILRAERSLND